MNDIKAVIRDVKKYPYKIARAVGFNDVVEYPHNEWMREIIFGKDDYTLLAHRGSYKSSCLSVCIALMMVFFPYWNIIFLRKADNDVTEMIRMVKKALESEFIQRLSIILYKKKLVMIESTAYSITTNLYISPSGSSQLLGIGLKSSITGKHADIVITDDICNISDRISKAERDRTKLQYQELQNVCNRGGRIINTGTRWHADDVFSLIENAVIYDYHDTGLISEEKAEDIRSKMTPSMFACNYELKIIASEDVIFTSPQTGADTGLVRDGSSHVDAAYGGEDYTAFTICKTKDGKFYVYGRLWRKHIDNVMDEIEQLHNNFMCNKMYKEFNDDKGFTAKEFRKRGIRVQTYHEHTNKYIKIASHLKFHWKDVIFVAGTDDEYIEQICDYNENAEHDDAPDSLASIIRQLAPKLGRDENTDNYMFY